MSGLKLIHVDKRASRYQMMWSLQKIISCKEHILEWKLLTFYRFSIENNSIRGMALDLFNDDICLSGYIGYPIDSTSLINISHLLMSWLKAQLHHYHSKQGLFVTIFQFKFIKEINISFMNLNRKIVWNPNIHLHSTILFSVFLI